MRFRIGLLVATVALVAVSACTSSGGTKKAAAKSGAGWFQARPLIMAGQRATTVRSDPFGALRVPTTEQAYSSLSRADQADLANALHGVDCAHPPQLAERNDRVLCDADSDVFLLGPALFTGNDVTKAKPIPPSASVAGWQVSLSLIPAAAKKMSRWTSQHHVLSQTGSFNDVQVSSRPPCGPTALTRCADFTAYISDSVVVTVPVSFTAVGKTVVISGEFDEVAATKLAVKLAG